MPWRTIGKDVDPKLLSRRLAEIEPVVCMVFDAFGSLCVLDAAAPDSLAIRVRHLGGSRAQTTVSAALRRQLDLMYPGGFAVKLVATGTENARLEIVPTEAA